MSEAATATRPPPVSDGSAARYLAALYADAPQDSLVELRYRVTTGMRHSFHPVDDLDAVAAEIGQRAPQTDVYVGVLPRHRCGGGRDDVVCGAAVLWADCDDTTAVSALRRFSPPPSIVVRSGTGTNRHAYWLLAEKHSLHVIEDANRRLATVLGADIACADPARILRPPSRNHKHGPPSEVRLDRCDQSLRHRLIDVAGDLPAPVVGYRRHPERCDPADPLLALSPRLYVEVLTGAAVSRDDKFRCPFHSDRTPSLHAYRDPARGWYCYGCRRGGSIYDFAALLWGLSTRGADFVELADALCLVFGPEDLVS